MSERGEISEEEYYVDESFEEDSQSEIEEQEVEEVEEEQEVEDEDEEDEDEDEDVEVVGQEQTEPLLEESDTQSDSDVEAEFIRGNVSPNPLQELTISQFSLTAPLPAPRPQPHARRHQMATGRTSGRNGFNRDCLRVYPSSSSDDESQVVVTKTVAEVNQLTLRLDPPEDDETPSVRTLRPGSAQRQIEKGLEDEVDEVEEIEEEEEIEDDDEEDAQSDGTMASNHGLQSAEEESDEDQATDVEVEQLEEDEPEIEAYTRNLKTKSQVPQEDLVSLVDASDNSSEHDSVVTMGMDGEEADLTLREASPKFQTQESEVEGLKISPPPIPALQQLNEFLNNGDPSLIAPPDSAAVKYLEQQMTQMSEMIMKTFRISGGAANNQAFEQLAMATDLMRNQRMEETESDMSRQTDSALTSARSCGRGLRPPMRSRLPRSQEALLSTRSAKPDRRKCRCPVESDLIEHEQELELSQQTESGTDLGLGMGQEGNYMMDECGQGDGLMRHPHPHQQHPQFNRRVASGTPSSFNSDECSYPIDVSRSRCSTDKVNFRNLGRKSFSFTNTQVREIDRQNQILLRKMMTVKPTAQIKASTSNLKLNASGPDKRPPPPAPHISSAAVNRKKFQRQIDLDNEVLKRKLEAIGTRRTQFK
ncbi:hypothetical protein KR009_002970 [Drosophila setifemur]|nr:hypothetical protein KR009_002970 [Drosophila setifemur]